MSDQNGNGNGAGDGNNSNGAGTGDSANQNQNQNQNGGGANGNSDANNQNQNGNGGGSNFDPEKDLTKEQWEAIYGSGRFKQLNDEAKKGRDLQKQIDDAEAERLKSEGKWQDLADKNAQTAERYKNAALNSKIEAIAAKNGSVDPEAVAALINRSGISIDDSLNVTGVEDAINALKESKPYLFNSENNNNNSTTRVGSPTSPGGNNTGYKFKMSEIKDPKFYKENAAAIKDAIKNGQVDKDN